MSESIVNITTVDQVEGMRIGEALIAEIWGTPSPEEVSRGVREYTKLALVNALVLRKGMDTIAATEMVNREVFDTA